MNFIKKELTVTAVVLAGILGFGGCSSYPEKKERAVKELKDLNCEKVTGTKQSGDDPVVYFGRVDFKITKVGEEWKLRKF